MRKAHEERENALKRKYQITLIGIQTMSLLRNYMKSTPVPPEISYQHALGKDG